MSRAVIRLGVRHKQMLHSGLTLLWASGALWLVFHYFFQVEGDFGPQPHQLENWWLRLHGLAAMLAFMLLGSLLPNHVKLAWTRRRNHRTGLSMLAVWAWLAATGYTLYYFSSDANAAWLPLLHWGVGLTLPALLVVHLKQARRRPARPARQPITAPSLHVVSTARPPSPPARRSAGL
jgi:cation transport ATPase